MFFSGRAGSLGSGSDRRWRPPPFGLIDDLDQVEVVRADHPSATSRSLNQSIRPRRCEGLMHQDHWILRLCRSGSGHRLEKLVEGAEATPASPRRPWVNLTKHELAGEEALEGLGDVLVGIGLLFHRQLDVRFHAWRLPK